MTFMLEDVEIATRDIISMKETYNLSLPISSLEIFTIMAQFTALPTPLPRIFISHIKNGQESERMKKK